jgi:hypothetical protein
MKTNQLVNVAFPNGILNIYHKSQMGNLKDVFKLGNKYRVLDDKEPIRLNQFINRKDVKEFIKSAKEIQGGDESNIWYKRGKGKGVQYFGNLHFIIYCAEMLSPKFHWHIIDTFISSHILKSRDDGGNDFKALNEHLNKLDDRVEGKNNRGLFIQVAIKLRLKVFGEKIINNFNQDKKDGKLAEKFNIWNSKYANSVHQNKRVRYESLLINYIQMGFVNSKEEVYQAIEKLR